MKREYSQQEKDLLLKIMKLSEDTSNVVLGIGYTSKSGQCESGLVIYNCAPKIIKELSKEENILLSAKDGKIFITILPLEKK